MSVWLLWHNSNQDIRLYMRKFFSVSIGRNIFGDIVPFHKYLCMLPYGNSANNVYIDHVLLEYNLHWGVISCVLRITLCCGALVGRLASVCLIQTFLLTLQPDLSAMQL